ncbi:hypothetical protein GA0074692_6754 [Micromonospora pallida]|uniref:HNH endonuclease n=1 Tax=Micromonospora pallida TaxID=145854 RepID=A0A1C6TNL9_9ACTN|nr:hypothetical protein [Micromonospora pallida]SCL43187.1 hypothetical protein GA0074692_6754 [Micromonospora pallida]
MPWLKVSDNAAFHQVVTGPLTEDLRPEDTLDPADLVNLAFGLVMRCATHAAGYVTDYLVTDGVVALMGGPNWRARAEMAERAGYWRRVDGGWVILDDPEHFVHIRLKAELDWERQRKRDNSDTALIIPVRLRDGDACRYCGVIVNWRARKGGRGGTYDHRVPGQAAAGPDDLLVACQTCNGFRSNHPDADQRRPARPAPAQPFYGSDTVALLAKHGYTVPLTAGRPGYPPEPAPAGDPATGRTTAAPASPPPAAGRPQRDPAASRNPRPTTARPGRQPEPAPAGDPATAPASPPPAAGRPQRDPAASRNPRPTTARPGRQPEPAPTRDPATTRATPHPTAPAHPPPTATPRDPAPGRNPRQHPGQPGRTRRDPAANGNPRAPAPPRQDQQRRRLADPADHRHPESGSPGRDGSGRESPTSTPTYRRVRRRARRSDPPSPSRLEHQPRTEHP